MSCLLVNCVSARVTLGVMAFLMFLVTQMIRVNLYITMVEIVKEGRDNGTLDRVNKTQWDENASGLFLGAFYWSYWATELPGGLLAQRFGGSKVLGIGVTVAGLVNLLLPMACHWHYLMASFLRAVQGLALGVTWPVMHWLSARWIPRSERSKFMTSYHGAAVGTAITYPLGGLIMTHFGWEYVFYSIGAVTLAWCFAWWILIFDSPGVHPRISESERKYLFEEIGVLALSDKPKKVKTPWYEIISSKPFWGVLVASQGLMWGTITLSMQTPAYFSQVHHLRIAMTGLFSGLPEIGKFFFALLFSTFMDSMISRRFLSVTAARKVAVSVSEYIPALLLILLSFYGAGSVTLAVVLLSLTSTAGGASSSGSLANVVDISPTHAGTILGLIKTLTIIPGVVSPLVATWFTRDGLPADKEGQWRNVFLFVALVYALCSTTFLVIGSGNVQPWDEKLKNVDKETLKEEEAVQPLKRIVVDGKTRKGSDVEDTC